MGLTAGKKDRYQSRHVFIGSCTNNAESKICVPPHRLLKVVKLQMVCVRWCTRLRSCQEQAEAEGGKIFASAGFEWREPGCSMCLAMNADKLSDGERCASTSNRNFEGRQGRGGERILSAANGCRSGGNRV